jgi:glycosyltransferase involved in cell wall biosynthesis
MAKNIELHTNVPDVKEYYKRCGVVIVPLIQGGGTRIKILEAALANRPVLSTPVGAEGLDLLDGREIMLFKNAQEFSHMYGQIVDTEKYHSLVNNARETVLKNYSPQKFNEAMKKVLGKNLA